MGTINHTLLSLEALRHRGMKVLGVAFIGEQNDDNMRTIGEMGDMKVLGRLPLVDDLSPENVSAAFAANFDLADFA